MELYLPIAEISINPTIFLILGMSVGILSGMFGVGGGFLMTPLLVLLGIPPAVAVASEANHIVGSSLSGTIGHLKRKAVDIKLGNLLLIGGIIGSFVGIWLGGSLYDMFGNYNLVWWVGIGVGAFSAIIHLPVNEKPLSERTSVATT